MELHRPRRRARLQPGAHRPGRPATPLSTTHPSESREGIARTRARCRCAPHRHDHPHPGDRPGLPAAQAPRPGAGVLAVLRHRHRLLPRGHRRALHGRAASSTSTRSDWRARGRATRPTSAWRSTSTTGRTPPRRCSASRWPTCSAPRAAAAATRARSSPTPPSRSRSRSRCCRAAAAPTSRTGSSSRSAGRSRPSRSRSTRRFAEWGDSRYVRLRLTGTVRLADALNQLHVLLPGAGRVEALLAGRRRGRQADALRRGLARRSPRGDADHPALPRPAHRAHPRRARPPRRAR